MTAKYGGEFSKFQQIYPTAGGTTANPREPLQTKYWDYGYVSNDFRDVGDYRLWNNGKNRHI